MAVPFETGDNGNIGLTANEVCGCLERLWLGLNVSG